MASLSTFQPLAAASAAPVAAARRALGLWESGQQHARHGRWPAAAAAYARAADLQQDAAYATAAAHALIKCGRAAEAVRRARQLRALQPLDPLGYTLESNAWLARGQGPEALACLEACPAGVAPDRAFLSSKAFALQLCGRHADAIPVFLQALGLKIDDAQLHYHLGSSFRQLGLKAEAAECVRTALVLGLGGSELAARAQLVFLEREACRWAQAADELQPLREALRVLPPPQPAETSPFCHAVLVDDPAEQLKVARHYALHVAGRVEALPRQRARAHGGRLRLGYLSSDFHNHATCELLVQVLEHHDRGRVEVFALSAGPDDGTALRRRVAAAVEHFVELRGCSHAQIAARVRELRIDILVDLKGATLDTLLPVLAARPAPLQVGWLGFPGSSGAPYIDYLVGDPVVTPLAHAPHYAEKIAQLPHCYQPNDARRERARPTRRSDWGLPEQALLLCAFHQSYKISEPVFDLWCGLLRERQDACLWLLQWNTNVEHQLRAAAAARGVDPQRLIFAPLLPLQQHLDRLACADLYLDAWPCNAHTTAGEALWVGVPVLTLRGTTFAQRVAASLLHTLQLDELVCDDAEAYRAKVLALAADPERRAALRRHLEDERDRNPLFDGAAFARDWEALLQRMWQRALRGAPPQHLAAEGRA